MDFAMSQGRSISIGASSCGDIGGANLTRVDRVACDDEVTVSPCQLACGGIERLHFFTKLVYNQQSPSYLFFCTVNEH